jgi:hypothetical protein
MPTPKKRFKPRKVKRRVVISQRAQLVKKGVLKAKNDTLRQVQGRPPADLAPTFKIKIRRK